VGMSHSSKLPSSCMGCTESVAQNMMTAWIIPAAYRNEVQPSSRCRSRYPAAELAIDEAWGLPGFWRRFLDFGRSWTLFWRASVKETLERSPGADLSTNSPPSAEPRLGLLSCPCRVDSCRGGRPEGECPCRCCGPCHV
jgi:hypothetical protein